MGIQINASKMNELLANIDKEYNLESRLNRYISTNPELVEMAAQHQLTTPEDAARALFISDFIVTSSEVPLESTDDERRISIFRAFHEAIQMRSGDSDKIMRVFYVCYLVAQQIKRNDSYLSGRGIKKESRIILLIDTIVMPYLHLISNLVTEPTCYFELGILSAALNRKYPDIEINRLDKTIDLDSEELMPTIMKIIRSFVNEHNAEVNDTVVLPNIKESQLLYMNTLKDLPSISLWKSLITDNNESIQAINKLQQFLSKSDNEVPLLYLRGEIVGTDNKIILARNPFADGNPMCIFITPAEEINLTETLSLLELRSKLDANWQLIPNGSKEIYTIEYEEKVIPKEIVEDVEVEEEIEVEVEEVIKVEVEKPKPTGFFSKLKRKFSSKQEEIEYRDEIRKHKEKKKVKKIIQQKRIEEITEKIEKKQVIGYSLPDELSHSIGIHLLSDLRLFEIFDTTKESDYRISGTLESNFEENTTTIYTSPSFIDPEKLTNTLDGLDEVIEDVINLYFVKSPQILPTEILFKSKEDKNLLICLNGNEKRIIGTIAKTFEKDMALWKKGEQQDEICQRRTLHMRTGQLLTARAHTPLDQAMKRIFGNLIVDNGSYVNLDHAILPL